MKRRRKKNARLSGLHPARRLAVMFFACVAVKALSARFDGPTEELVRSFANSAAAETIVKAELFEPIVSGITPGWENVIKLELPFSDTDVGTENENDEKPTDDMTEEEMTEKTPTQDEPESEDTSEQQEKDGQTPENDAQETTITGEDGQYYLAAEGIYLKNNTGYEIDVPAILEDTPAQTGSGGKVLIIHTHGSEAYTPDGDDTYMPSDPSRTTDKRQNVIRVGDELERVLTERGIEVIHDRNMYDYPAYKGAYSRAYDAILEHIENNSDIISVIDLHRDALEGEDGTVYKTVADIDGKTCAQVMIISGTDYTGLEHPKWRENLSLALHIQAAMVMKYPSLARPLNISQYRYNQHATTGSLIVEVGCSGNTLQEALDAVSRFGDCFADVLLGENG